MLDGKYRIVTSPHARGASVRPDMEQLIRDAMPAFVQELLPTLRSGDVWLIQERSAAHLEQMLAPIGELLKLLDSPAFAAKTVATKRTLRTIQLGARQLFWVAITQGDDVRPMQIASGRLNLDQLHALA